MSLVRTLVNEVERQGVDVTRFLAEGPLDPAALANPTARVDMDLYDRLQTVAIERTGDPALGLHMGEHSSPTAFNVVGLLTSQCRTIRECLEVMFRYYSIVGDVPAPYLVDHGPHVRFVYRYARSTPLCNRLRAEFGVTLLVRVGQAFARSSDLPIEIWFEHSRPEYGGEYDRLFEGRARFDMPCTAVILERAWLDREQLFADPQVFTALKQKADEMLRELEHGRSVADQVRRLIVEEFDTLRPEMPSVARRLGMSPRSLRRRLTEEGASFSALVADAMGNLACAALREGGTTIQEVAFRLGFAEVSSFHRAFKRWTGKTPKQYRDELTP